jgi:hypothetical protein
MKVGKVEKAPRRLVILLTIVGVLALAPSAVAQSTPTGYGGQAGGVAGQVQQGGAGGEQGVAGEAGASQNGNGTAASNASSGNGVLPFTGLDLALIAGGGLMLLAGGVALSRLVARNPA